MNLIVMVKILMAEGIELDKHNDLTIRGLEVNRKKGGNSMKAAKKQWVAPDLQIFGDMQSLTQGNGKGPPCPPPLHKGQGTNDTLQNDTANQNTGCTDHSSGI